MRRTQQGDKQAFSLLYERYSGSVLSYLYRMLGNVEDVESIGQEVSSAPSASPRPTAIPRNSAPGSSHHPQPGINHARRKKRSPVGT